MERYETAQDVWDEVWNDSREENVSNSDSNFSDFEENSGANEDDESFDSHDSEAKVSFDSERFFVVCYFLMLGCHWYLKWVVSN